MGRCTVWCPASDFCMLRVFIADCHVDSYLVFLHVPSIGGFIFVIVEFPVLNIYVICLKGAPVVVMLST
jgi:hypothetical protein